MGLPEDSPHLGACSGLPGFTNVNITLLIGWDAQVGEVLHAVPTPDIRHEYALV